MNCCKNICDNYKVFSKWISYSKGTMCYCSLCNKNFERKDVMGLRCFCCKGKIRTTPKSKKNRIVKRI